MGSKRNIRVKRATLPVGWWAALTCALLLGGAASCGGSDASTTTCTEFSALTESKQDAVLNDLLSDHGKEDGAMAGESNRIQLRGQVEVYCGIYSLIGGSPEATKNQDSPIVNGSDFA